MNSLHIGCQMSFVFPIERKESRKQFSLAEFLGVTIMLKKLLKLYSLFLHIVWAISKMLRDLQEMCVWLLSVYHVALLYFFPSPFHPDRPTPRLAIYRRLAATYMGGQRNFTFLLWSPIKPIKTNDPCHSASIKPKKEAGEPRSQISRPARTVIYLIVGK